MLMKSKDDLPVIINSPSVLKRLYLNNVHWAANVYSSFLFIFQNVCSPLLMPNALKEKMMKQQLTRNF